MLGLQLTLRQELRPRRQDRITRYDKKSIIKFDSELSVKPNTRVFNRYGGFFKDHFSDGDAAPTSKAVVLADINLQARGKIGLVLGSIVRDLTSPPGNLDKLDGHRDLDVLILNRHNKHNPRPNEWGIDWWVRPAILPPTNGRVSLWYDFCVKPNVAPLVRSKSFPGEQFIIHPSSGRPTFFAKQNPHLKTPINLDLDSGYAYCDPNEREAVHQERQLSTRSFILSNREKTDFVLVPPGLYLPDAQTMKAIIEHCTRRSSKEEKPKDFRYLDLEGVDGRNALFPTLPHDLLTFKPL